MLFYFILHYFIFFLILTADNVVKEPSILVCNSVGGVVGLRAAIDRYISDYLHLILYGTFHFSRF